MATVEVQYEITVMESERGWGQRYETERFDTREEAQERIDYINSFNVAPVAPDWYMQAFPEIRIVEV